MGTYAKLTATVVAICLLIDCMSPLGWTSDEPFGQLLSAAYLLKKAEELSSVRPDEALALLDTAQSGLTKTKWSDPKLSENAAILLARIERLCNSLRQQKRDAETLRKAIAPLLKAKRFETVFAISQENSANPYLNSPQMTDVQRRIADARDGARDLANRGDLALAARDWKAARGWYKKALKCNSEAPDVQRKLEYVKTRMSEERTSTSGAGWFLILALIGAGAAAYAATSANQTHGGRR